MAHMKAPTGIPPAGAPYGAAAMPDFNVINQHLANCQNAAEVLMVVDKWGMYFNQINLGTALFYLGEAKAKDADTGVDLAKAPQVVVMANAAKDHAALLGPKQLAEVLWGLAHCGYRGDVEFFDVLAREVLQKLNEFTAAFMACTFWGFAELGYIPGNPLLRTAAEMMQTNLAMFPGKACVDMMWALAKMEFTPSPALCREVLVQLLPQLKMLQPSDVANLLWAYSEFSFNPGLEFLQGCVGGMLETMQQWDLESIATALVAFGAFTFHPGNPLLAAVSDAVVGGIPTAPLPSILKLLNYCTSVLHHPGIPLLAAVALRLQSTPAASPLPPSHIAAALLAFGTFGWLPPAPLLQHLALQVDQQLMKLTALDTANMLWCYALFNACTPDVWTTLSRRLGQFSEDQVPVPALTRLFQVYLLIKASAGPLADSTMTPRLLMTATNQWKALVLTQSQEAPSDLLQDIARIMTLMGVPFAMKRLTEDGTMCIDVAFVHNGVQVALLACDPDHFCSNAQANSPLGSTLMQLRLLEACRLKVLSVPYYEWQALANDQAKAQYLQTLCARMV